MLNSANSLLNTELRPKPVLFQALNLNTVAVYSPQQTKKKKYQVSFLTPSSRTSTPTPTRPSQREIGQQRLLMCFRSQCCDKHASVNHQDNKNSPILASNKCEVCCKCGTIYVSTSSLNFFQMCFGIGLTVDLWF